jgi:hypothetical protein
MLLTLHLNKQNVAAGATTFTLDTTHDITRLRLLNSFVNTDSSLPLFAQFTAGLTTNSYVLDGTNKIANAFHVDVDNPMTLLKERRDMGASITLQLFELDVDVENDTIARVNDVDSIFSDGTMSVVLVFEATLAQHEEEDV